MWKKRLIPAAALCVFFVLVAAFELSAALQGTIQIKTDDMDAVEAAIQSYFTSDGIEIRKVVVEDDVVFALYGNKNSRSRKVSLIIFEKRFPIGNIYKRKGGASSSRDISVGGSTRDVAGHGGVIVVYGHNFEVCAKSYTLYNDGAAYVSDIADPYILDVYFLDEEADFSPYLTLYDENGHIIS